MNYVRKASRRAGEKSSSRWEDLLRAHAETLQRYQAAANAAQSDPTLEADADGALHELLSLEAQALRSPADSADAFRFKLSLWSDGRIDGYDEEWKVFAEDCERLLLNANDK